jgi:hypothetical protein
MRCLSARTVNEHYLRLFRIPYLKLIIVSDADRRRDTFRGCRRYGTAGSTRHGGLRSGTPPWMRAKVSGVQRNPKRVRSCPKYRYRHPANKRRYEQRTTGERMADRLSASFGSWSFILAQA